VKFITTALDNKHVVLISGLVYVVICELIYVFHPPLVDWSDVDTILATDCQPNVRTYGLLDVQPSTPGFQLYIVCPITVNTESMNIILIKIFFIFYILFICYT